MALLKKGDPLPLDNFGAAKKIMSRGEQNKIPDVVLW